VFRNSHAEKLRYKQDSKCVTPRVLSLHGNCFAGFLSSKLVVGQNTSQHTKEPKEKT
jgi:hypothetical protein